MKDLLGGKGAGLAEMTNLGVPVPAGFTISTEACVAYFKNKRKYPPGLWEEVLRYMKRLESTMGSKFGDPSNPLLVSVRSGARASMPGMLDTVLNLGLNDRTVLGLARWTKNERFAWDCYRRFITIFVDVVLCIDRHAFDELLDRAKTQTGARTDADLQPEPLKALVVDFKRLMQARTGKAFPQDPGEQLRLAVSAVFDSWF